MRKFFLVFLALNTLMSCADYSTERSQVADLLDQLDTAKEVFENNGPETLPMKPSDIKDRLSIITEHYRRREQLIDKDLGLMLADFKVYLKVFKGLPAKRQHITDELALSYKQLQNLDQDLKNKSIDQAKLEKYLSDESIAVKAVTAAIYQLDTLMTRGSEGYLREVGAIDSVMTSLGAEASE